MAILGLDIGSDTIKVVEMQRKGRNTWLLRNYGVTPTPPGAVVNGEVQDAEVLGEAVRQMLKSRRIKPSPVVSSVQGQQSVVVRIIEVPRMSKGELADTMKYEVERHIPFAASQVIMDYAVLDRPGEPTDSPNMEVLFAAVQEDLIANHVGMLRKAKLKPKAIDVQPLALGHALVECAPDHGGGLGETVAVVNIGASGTDLSIIKDGLLHFPRSIPIGGRSITQRLSEGLGVGEQQAERLKRQHASMRGLPAGLAARLATPADSAEAEDEAPAADIDFGMDLFDLDAGEDSDVGFGGTGTVGGALAFEDTGDEAVAVPDEEPGRTPFDLGSELGDEGAGFTFGDETPAAGAQPAAGDGAFTFSFTEDEPAAPADTAAEAADSELFSFGDTDEPAAEPADSGGFDMGLSDDDDAAPSDLDEPFSFDEEPAAAEADATTPGGSEAPEFDFNLGPELGGSSLAPAEAVEESATEVGSSFDLGEDDKLGFDFGASAPGEPAVDLGADAEVEAPAPVAAGEAGGAEPLTPEDEERLRVREAIEPVLRELVAEVGRSLEYYRSRYDGAVVDRVTLVGGTARIDGLAEFFEDELGLPVETGDPLAAVVVGNNRLQDEDLRRDAPVLAVAVGLALRDLT